MVWAGGSASWTIGDRGATDPGGIVGGSGRRQLAWQLPALGHRTTTDCGQHERRLLDRTEGVLGSGNPMVPVSTLGMGGGSLPVAPQVFGA